MRLQLGDIAGDVGGRGVQSIGGAGEAASGDDGGEDLKGAQTIDGKGPFGWPMVLSSAAQDLADHSAFGNASSHLPALMAQG
jgi:hypothetical protein